MNKYVKNTWTLCKESISFLYEGMTTSNFPAYLKTFLFLLLNHLHKFCYQLNSAKTKQAQFATLQKRVKGLHEIMSSDPLFSYSILIPLKNPSPDYLKSCLLSACDQTPTRCEILIGSDTPLSNACHALISDVQSLHQNKVFFHDFTHLDKNDYLLNQIALKSTMNFLFILEENDWLRPDLLFRYEQYLRTFDSPEKTIVCCTENLINKNGYILPKSDRQKTPPAFPYLFQKANELRGMLIPTQLWMECKGLRQEFKGADTEDLLLRLDLAGGTFGYIPFSLYSHRQSVKSDIPLNKTVFIHALKEYAKNKNLAWEYTLGDHPHYVRAIPKVTANHRIHVIIPFKEQKELTLRCLASLLKQEGVEYVITAIDNGSKDISIAQAITELGGEVIRIDEPFNYSRLNNLAVERSKLGQSCDLLLFLNNDVEMEKGALLEMVRWIDQPNIGIVGARLNYPDGRLQHGGITLDAHRFPERLCYDHLERFKEYGDLLHSRSIYLADALTAACILVKKDTFLNFQGFDELWFPVSLSDTDLAKKMANENLRCLYTPYAVGIHHESVSRKVVLEDIEHTRWMHEVVSNKRALSKGI